MSNQAKNPVAFITGASRGIGRGIALALAAEGYDIVGAATQADSSNTEKGLYEVKAKVEQLGQQFLPVTGDIIDRDDHSRMVNKALDHFGAIDLLVNNAGVGVEHRLDILETTPESYARVMDINLQGPFFLTQLIANKMITATKFDATYAPSIIFITSISATTASPNRAEYCVSKAGLSMVAQNFAVRLAEYGINVYEIQPGLIRTDMTAGVQDKYDQQIEDGLLLQKRWGTPEDIGKTVAAFANGHFNYATGTIIEVGGGLNVKRL
jgi:3-oxoacyl-[acyl-carrier protein] reductase